MDDTLFLPPNDDLDPGVRDTAAIVTGGGSQGEGIGNGRAAALLLAKAGARVAVVDNNRSWADRTTGMIRDAGGTAVTLVADVGDDDDVRRAVDHATAELGPVRTLVNNVGWAGAHGTAETLDLAEWDLGFRVNVTAMMLFARHVVPVMRAAGGGSIVNIGSVAGLTGGHHDLLYPASKGAVTNMTRAMAVHHGPDRIRVNCVAPGQVYTPMVVNAGVTDEMRPARVANSTLPYEGTGWDVAQAVLFLAGRGSRWITGAVVPVDAGLSSRDGVSAGTRGGGDK
jgi:NAD(P)-dependent dehydrogenase (short-subunit alcohol dehydrogenase family)